MRVSGTGWPAEQQVAVILAPFDSTKQTLLQKVRSDSRGNLSALLAIPTASSLPSGPLWLFAVIAVDQGDIGRVVAQVAVPFDLPATGSDPSSMPPQLFVLAQSGEQAGGLRSY